MASQCVPLDVCGSVFTMRVTDLVTEGLGRMLDTRREIKARPLAYTVSKTCPLLKTGLHSAQMIYADAIVIF